MPTIDIDGMRFTGTPEECAAFALTLKKSSLPKVQLTVPPIAGQTPVTGANLWPFALNKSARPAAATAAAAAHSVNRELERLAVGFLRALRDAGRDGLDSGTVQKLVGAAHPKGIGSKLMMISNALLGVGIKDVESCFHSTRNPIEGRRWYAGVAVSDAILTLEQSLRRRQAKIEEN